MSRKLFLPGGPLNIEDLGADQFRASITLPTDEDGRMARVCPDDACSPGTFKVKPGTGITGGQTVAYCPYCRRAEAPVQFATQEQERYAKDMVMRGAARRRRHYPRRLRPGCFRQEEAGRGPDLP